MSSIEAMQPLLKDASVVIIKGCGHAPILERPQESAADYLKFIDQASLQAAEARRTAPRQ